MKPGKSTSFEREKTGEPGTNWESKSHQTPITQHQLEPENIPAASSASKTQQGPNIQQEPAFLHRPLTQQESLVQEEYESQQEPRPQSNSVWQQKCLAPGVSMLQQLFPMQKAPLSQQDATYQQASRPEKESENQLEPGLREDCVSQPGSFLGWLPTNLQEYGFTSPTQLGEPTEPASLETPSPSDPQAQEAPSQEKSEPRWNFLSKLQELPFPHPVPEWKTFFKLVTTSNSELDMDSPLETTVLYMKEDSTPELKLDALKRNSSYDVRSGSGGSPFLKKNISNLNHRLQQSTGECEPGVVPWRDSPRRHQEG